MMVVFYSFICHKLSKSDTRVLQFVFESHFMSNPHRSLGVVEMLCFISKHKLCLDENTYVLCRIIAVWGLLGSDSFGILILDTLKFSKKNSLFKASMVTSLFLMTLSAIESVFIVAVHSLLEFLSKINSWCNTKFEGNGLFGGKVGL